MLPVQCIKNILLFNLFGISIGNRMNVSAICDLWALSDVLKVLKIARALHDHKS